MADRLTQDLLAQGYALEETHISRVFLDARYAWKVKKAVDFGFLDFGSLEKRKRACESELALNRRFSPDIYLDLVPVTWDGSRHAFGGTGEIREWAVRMRRLPGSDRADSRLREGTLGENQLATLAARLAAFHGSGECGPNARYGAPRAIARNLLENLGQIRAHAGGLLHASAVGALDRRLKSAFRHCLPAMAERHRHGKVRDGHGDLRLGQMYFDAEGRCSLLDCIEFNDRFRFGDPASDIAFLAMDLGFRGRRDLAEGFLAAYARESGDYGLYAVVDYYIAYRASVRGKVAVLTAMGTEDPDAKRAAEREARAYFRYALESAGRKRTGPIWVAFGGGIATGKSTLAEALGRRLRAPVIGSDRERKRMAGVAPFERAGDSLGKGAYAPEFTGKVYDTLGDLAGAVNGSGRPVILDASFRKRAHREAMRARAQASGSPFLFIECRADAETCRGRLRRRAESPSVSDGNLGNFEALSADWDQGDSVPAEEKIVLDTRLPFGECLDRAAAACESRIGPATR